MDALSLTDVFLTRLAEPVVLSDYTKGKNTTGSATGGSGGESTSDEENTSGSTAYCVIA